MGTVGIHSGTMLAISPEQEATKMVLDMTAQLAPVMWMIVALMAISGVSLLMSHR